MLHVKINIYIGFFSHLYRSPVMKCHIYFKKCSPTSTFRQPACISRRFILATDIFKTPALHKFKDIFSCPHKQIRLVREICLLRTEPYGRLCLYSDEMPKQLWHSGNYLNLNFSGFPAIAHIWSDTVLTNLLWSKL